MDSAQFLALFSHILSMYSLSTLVILIFQFLSGVHTLVTWTWKALFPFMEHSSSPPHLPNSDRCSRDIPDTNFLPTFSDCSSTWLDSPLHSLLKTENDNLLKKKNFTPLWTSCPCSERSGTTCVWFQLNLGRQS